MTTVASDNMSTNVTSRLKLLGDAGHLDIAYTKNRAELVVCDLPVINMAKKIHKNTQSFRLNPIGSRLASVITAA